MKVLGRGREAGARVPASSGPGRPRPQVALVRRTSAAARGCPSRSPRGRFGTYARAKPTRPASRRRRQRQRRRIAAASGRDGVDPIRRLARHQDTAVAQGRTRCSPSLARSMRNHWLVRLDVGLPLSPLSKLSWSRNGAPAMKSVAGCGELRLSLASGILRRCGGFRLRRCSRRPCCRSWSGAPMGGADWSIPSSASGRGSTLASFCEDQHGQVVRQRRGRRSPGRRTRACRTSITCPSSGAVDVVAHEAPGWRNRRSSARP